VDSILGQSFGDFEFIIIDDGSTDASPAILKSYSDPRLRLIQNEQNIGLTRSLNEGLELAKGQYIARMDADDISLPQRFEKQIAFMKVHPECVVVGADVMMIDPDGDSLCRLRHSYDHDLIDRDCLRGNGTALSHPVILVRKSAMETVGGYDAAVQTGQDLDLYLKLCEVGKAFNLPEILLLWRQHPQSVNRTRHETWPQVKTAAIGAAIRRRGMEAYLCQLFREDSFPGPEQFDEHCFSLAEQGDNYKCALKYLRRIVAARGAKARDLRQMVVLYLKLGRQVLRSLINGKNRSQSSMGADTREGFAPASNIPPQGT
jgi:glycosyltransferase involved in cell wall biosynthesis